MLSIFIFLMTVKEVRFQNSQLFPKQKPFIAPGFPHLHQNFLLPYRNMVVTSSTQPAVFSPRDGFPLDTCVQAHTDMLRLTQESIFTAAVAHEAPGLTAITIRWIPQFIAQDTASIFCSRDHFLRCMCRYLTH